MDVYGFGWKKMVVFSDYGIYRYWQFLLIGVHTGHKVSQDVRCIARCLGATSSRRVPRIKPGLHPLQLAIEIAEK